MKETLQRTPKTWQKKCG